MPDLKMRYPSTIFVDDAGSPDKELIQKFTKVIAPFVAISLDCNDFSGAALKLLPEQIDIHLMPYESQEVRFLGSPVLVEITGYDYPDRMKNIHARLVELRDVLSAFIRGYGKYYDPNGREVSVTYIPVPDGCWA